VNKFSLALTGFLLVLLTACSKSEPPPPPEVARPAKMFMVQASGANFWRSFPGAVQATNQAELAFRVGGELIEFPATRGKQVTQGDLLARLDPADYQAALASAQAQYDLALAQYNRAAELVDRQLIAQADYEKREAMMKVRRSSLAQARNNLDYTSLYAPFDGVVARQLAENFESVTAGQVVMTIQTGDMVDVIVDVPESIIARFERVGTNRELRPVQVVFDSASDQVFAAHYKEHETQADSATLTYKVTFSLPSPTGLNILPGMTATVNADLAMIYEEDLSGHLVPIEAVFSAEEMPLDSEIRNVWIVDPDSMRASLAEVRVGPFSGNQILVTEGLEGGETIVAAGVNAVHEGMLLRSMEREGGL